MKTAVRQLGMLAILLAVSGQTALAGCLQAEDRPSVGLVLSGGGARGVAHIGVLRELERLRVPVDCVAGTSMGAIVGGLYASGMAPDDIEALVRRIDWSHAFSDRPERRDLSFRRKQDDRSFLIKFKLGLRDGELALPKGLVQGQKQNMILKAATLPVAGIHNFDRLPIPFRAVTTDIETGESIALGQGNLAASMQASMTVPGVFAPRDIGGRLLVDGGLTNNLPVSVVREMGADVVIAVDIMFPLVSRDELESSLDMANQMLTIMMQQTTQREKSLLAEDDLQIRPDLGGMDSADFTRLGEAIESGARSVSAVAERLNHLSLEAGAFAEHVARRAVAIPGVPFIDYVTVSTDSRLDPAVIERRLHATAGEPLDQARLERDIARIHGLDTFEEVDYEVVAEGELTGLEVNARAKSWGPSFLDFGLSLEEDFEGASDYTLAARYTRAELNHLGGEWRIDLALGQRSRFFSEFYQPLDLDTRFFIAPQLEVSRNNVGFFEDGQRVAEYRVTSRGGGIDLGHNFGNWGELRAGIRRTDGRADPRIGEASLPVVDFDSGGWFTSFKIDWLDNANFPRNGQFGTLSWQAERDGLGADLDSDVLRLDWLGASTWGRHTLLAGLRFARAIDDELAIQDTFTLGGLFRLSGYSADELAGRQLGLATLIYYQEVAVGHLAALDVPVYAGGSLEAGNVWQTRDEVSLGDLRYAGSFFLGIDTPLGPVYLAIGLAEGGNTAGYFYLGQTF